MNRRLWTATVPALLLLALSLTACASRAPARISVEVYKWRYEPTSWTVSAGREVEITLINHCTFEHSWVLLDKGYTFTPPFDEDDQAHVLWQGSVRNTGVAHTYTFTAPSEPGEYPVLCGISSHLEESEVGTLIVK